VSTTVRPNAPEIYKRLVGHTARGFEPTTCYARGDGAWRTSGSDRAYQTEIIDSIGIALDRKDCLPCNLEG
jgi:hypothetical protein